MHEGPARNPVTPAAGLRGESRVCEPGRRSTKHRGSGARSGCAEVRRMCCTVLRLGRSRQCWCLHAGCLNQIMALLPATGARISAADLKACGSAVCLVLDDKAQAEWGRRASCPHAADLGSRHNPFCRPVTAWHLVHGSSLQAVTSTWAYQAEQSTASCRAVVSSTAQRPARHFAAVPQACRTWSPRVACMHAQVCSGVLPGASEGPPQRERPAGLPGAPAACRCLPLRVLPLSMTIGRAGAFGTWNESGPLHPTVGASAYAWAALSSYTMARYLEHPNPTSLRGALQRASTGRGSARQAGRERLGPCACMLMHPRACHITCQWLISRL